MEEQDFDLFSRFSLMSVEIMEEEKYAVEIIEYGGAILLSILLYEKVDGVLTSRGNVPLEYAIDKEIGGTIRNAVKQGKPFMVTEGRSMYQIPMEFGEALKMHSKVFRLLPNLHEKLLYVENTQIFTLIETQQFKELQDRLNLYYLVKKIEGSTET